MCAGTERSDPEPGQRLGHRPDREREARMALLELGRGVLEPIRDRLRLVPLEVDVLAPSTVTRMPATGAPPSASMTRPLTLPGASRLEREASPEPAWARKTSPRW